MHIHRVDTADQGDVRRYVEFPFRLYESSTLWVPPLISDIQSQLDPNGSPFYQHSQAAFFLAQVGGETVGRIAVLDNSRYNEYRQERTAFFYHFDAVNDRAASRALFDAASDWARGRGLDRMWGPKGFIPGDGQGLLADGFEHRPAMGIAYNYPYYDDLVRDAGFEKRLDFLSAFMDRQISLSERFLTVAEKVKRRQGFQTMSFRRKSDLRAMIPRLAAIYNDAFVQVEGFVPITEAEARAFGARILAVADPTMVKILMKDDEIAGFVLAYPDLSAGMQRCRGRLWPMGWMHLSSEARRTSWINFNGAAILDRFRGIGGNALLYAEMYHTLIGRTQYQYGDLVQIQETNTRMVQELEALGVDLYKRHRIYERTLA